MVDFKKLPSAGTALAFIPGTGEDLCLGMENGSVAVLDRTLQVVTAFQHSRQPISSIKFSPNRKLLAVGSKDTNIYLYSVPAENGTPAYSRLGVCRGHAAPITHLDFSFDSRFIQSNDESYKLMFWNKWGDLQTHGMNGKITNQTKWATITCTLGWECAGMWAGRY